MLNYILAETDAELGSSFIHNIFKNILKTVGGVGFDIIFYISIALVALNILIMLLIIWNSYEVKLLKSVKKLNRFFEKNPHVSEDNLITLNDKMKKVPKTLRYCWQEYMLYRDKLPSDYMTTTTCIDQPIKTSKYGTALKVASIFGVIIGILSFLSYIGMIVNLATGITVDGEVLKSTTPISVNMIWQFVTVPLLVVAVNYLFVVIGRYARSNRVKDLYFEFHDFSRFVNKACATMPSFIDYEVLFTQKEIKEGIPVLQEYLEKRALQEQKEAENAKLNAVEYEKFDFNDLGIENAILLDRAMKESEKYFNVKRDLTEKLNAKESEINNFSKNFDEVTKDYERKAQAIKENLTQLNEQLNNTVVKIEANYIKKRHNEEQVKLQQLEKDYDLASVRFNKQQSDLEEECEVLRNEIKERKSDVEEAIKVEGKAYANKVYGIINRTITAQNEPYFSKLEQEKQELANQVSTLSQNLNAVQAELEARKNQIAQAVEELNYRKAEIAAISSVREYFTSLEFKQLVKNNKKKLKKGEVSNEYSEMIEQLQTELNNKQAEVDRLNQAINQMQQELTMKTNELSAKNEELKMKNSELDSKNAELQEKNTELQEKDKKIAEQEKVIGEHKGILHNKDEELKSKNAQKEENENRLLSKLKSLEGYEKKYLDEKNRIKSKNLDKLRSIQKDIETENKKYLSNSEKLKKKIDDTAKVIEESKEASKVSNDASKESQETSNEPKKTANDDSLKE